jgi:hypothetical protein
MTNKKYEEKYTKPDLREELKEEIKASDKGGKPGQWSARKSQLLVQEYEKQGGGYKQNEKDESARSLEEWSEQDWQTKEGEGNARSEDGTKRYLPKKVWDKLSDKEKKEADRTKQKADQKGDQHVEWTPAIKRAMKESGYSPDHDSDSSDGSGKSDSSDSGNSSKQELYDEAKELDISGRSKMNKDELADAINKAKD